MTYPPSPYGGYPGQNEPGQYGQPQSYGPPQQQRYPAGAQQYYGPPGHWPPPQPPRKKSKRSLVVIVAVVLVVLIGGGISAWAFWPQSQGNVQQADRKVSQNPNDGQAKPKESLQGRSKEELLKVLPTLQDMPTGWKEAPQGSTTSGEVAPAECARVMPKGMLTNVINRYFVNPEDHFESGIEAYLFRWDVTPQLEKMKDYVGTCASYTRTVSGGENGPDTVYSINVAEVSVPKVPADATFGYEETGTVDPVPDGQSAALSPDRYYMASLRGLDLIFLCRNIPATKDKCEEAFVRTTTQIANID